MKKNLWSFSLFHVVNSSFFYVVNVKIKKELYNQFYDRRFI